MSSLDVWFNNEIQSKLKATAFAAGLKGKQAHDQVSLLQEVIGNEMNYTGKEIQNSVESVESAIDKGFASRFLKSIGH